MKEKTEILPTWTIWNEKMCPRSVDVNDSLGTIGHYVGRLKLQIFPFFTLERQVMQCDVDICLREGELGVCEDCVVAVNSSFPKVLFSRVGDIIADESMCFCVGEKKASPTHLNRRIRFKYTSDVVGEHFI